MDLHYNRHHKTYLTNLNAALDALATAQRTNDLLTQLELQSAIKFNAGGHINHTLFWTSLAPATSGLSSANTHAPTLTAAITQRWGSLSAFQAAFTARALAIQGSGWAWLVKDPETGELGLATSKDQDLPVDSTGKMTVAVLGVDMWEHAYYLQYTNDKKGYLAGIWDVVNWKEAERRFGGDRAGVYGSLAGLASRL